MMNKEEKKVLRQIGIGLTSDFVNRVIDNSRGREDATELELAKKILEMACRRDVGEKPSDGEAYVPFSSKEIFQNLLDAFTEDLLNGGFDKEDMKQNAEVLIEMRSNLQGF